MKLGWVNMKASKFLLFILVSSFLSACTQLNWPTISTILKDRKAAHTAEKENFSDALIQYYSILDEAPENPSVHSNIGVLLKQKSQPEEALKSLNYALELAKSKNDKRAEFAIQFNLGVYYGTLKKISEALDHYQAALDITPDSLETKTNIELLMQQQQQQQKSGGEGQKKDQQDQSKSDQDQKNQDQKQGEGKKENTAKYKPRPFKGDQLSESDVKKILGELKNQEQKIRSNFDKKEKKGKTSKNEKDW